MAHAAAAAQVVRVELQPVVWAVHVDLRGPHGRAHALGEALQELQHAPSWWAMGLCAGRVGAGAGRGGGGGGRTTGQLSGGTAQLKGCLMN